MRMQPVIDLNAGVVVISTIVFLSGGCLYIKKPPERPRCRLRCNNRLTSNGLCTENIELDALLDPNTKREQQSDTDAKEEQSGTNLEEEQCSTNSEGKESGTDSEQCSEDFIDDASQPLVPRVSSESPEQHLWDASTNFSLNSETVESEDVSYRTRDGEGIGSHKSTGLKRLKQLVPIIKVFTPLIIFWAVFYQRSSTWIVQATQMDCYVGSLHIPPDVMPSIEDVMVLFVVPFLEYLLYPHLKRSMGIEVRPIHKLVFGMIAITLSFFLAGLLQIYITEPAEECRGDVSIAWQLPQLFLLSFADVLVFVTGLEFAYTQSPPDLRNIVTSLYFIIQALGTVLNAAIALIPMSLLTAFFVYVALMTLATIFFIILNRKSKFSCYEQPESSH